VKVNKGEKAKAAGEKGQKTKYSKKSKFVKKKIPHMTSKKTKLC